MTCRPAPGAASSGCCAPANRRRAPPCWSEPRRYLSTRPCSTFEDALDSAEIYEVDRPIGGRVALYGVSVFALWPGIAPVDVLRRFASSPYHLQARAADVRPVGFNVLATGSNPDHFDVLLVDGRAPEESLLPLAALVAAARRLVDACGELRPNPAYSGGSHG